MYEILIEEDCIAGFVNRPNDLAHVGNPCQCLAAEAEKNVRFDDRVHSLREELEPRRILSARGKRQPHIERSEWSTAKDGDFLVPGNTRALCESIRQRTHLFSAMTGRSPR